MAALGSRPILYRSSVTGQVTYMMKRDSKPGEDFDPPPHDPPSPIRSVLVNYPQRGSTITGPAAGVTVAIHGNVVVRDDPNDIAGVDVSLDGQKAEAAEPATVNGPLTSWKITKKIDQLGQHTVQATARPKQGKLNKSGSTIFRVELTAPAEDPTPAKLEVVTPREGTSIFAAEGDFKVDFRGFAAPADLASLQVLLDHGGPSSTAGTPAAQNDYSSWTSTVMVATEGANSFTVRATTRAGNTVERTINVTMTRTEPIILGRPRLALAESVTLSSFLGVYGAGRVVRTFSLLPGEKTKISIRMCC